MTQKVIAVYGSAIIQPRTPEYREAYFIGRDLAHHGFAVMTGGYGGMMGAVSHGAAEAGGRVIGITVTAFRQQGLDPNPFLHEEVELPNLTERTNYLITKPDGYVVLKGGVGTLAELALAWSMVQIAEVGTRPLLTVGRLWIETLEVFGRLSTIKRERDLAFITSVETGPEVVPALQQWFANPPKITPRLGDAEEKVPPLEADMGIDPLAGTTD